MKEFIITFKDLSSQKQNEIYDSVGKEVKEELMKSMPQSERLKITFGELDKLIEERIKECNFKFAM